METLGLVPGGITVLPHRRFREGAGTYVYAADTGGLFRMSVAVRGALSVLSSPNAPSVPRDLLEDLARAGVLRTAEVPDPPVRTVLPPLCVRTLVLMLTDSCNLSCRYCYEEREEGCAAPTEGGGVRQEMSPGTIRNSIAFLLDRSGERRRLSVVFFGGEPLLRFPVLRNAVRDARAMAGERGKEISFSLTTNGTLLTPEIAAFLREHRVSVCVSVDGPREVHDRNRSYPSGRGSYEDVIRGVSFLAGKGDGGHLAARVTLGRGAVGVKEIFDHLRGLGFSEIGFAPVSAVEGSASLLTERELDRAMRGFRELAAGYIADVRERKMPAFSNMTQVLSLIHRGDPMPFPCGAGIGMLAVDPSGSFYPCHRLCGAGEPLGDPARGIFPGRRDRFLEGARRGRASTCGSCWAKNFCSGGCYHDASLRQGDLFAPSTHYCKWIRQLFLLGLRTYVRIQNETPTFLEAMFNERGTA